MEKQVLIIRSEGNRRPGLRLFIQTWTSPCTDTTPPSKRARPDAVVLPSFDRGSFPGGRLGVQGEDPGDRPGLGHEPERRHDPGEGRDRGPFLADEPDPGDRHPKPHGHRRAGDHHPGPSDPASEAGHGLCAGSGQPEGLHAGRKLRGELRGAPLSQVRGDDQSCPGCGSGPL